ncbi:MAG: hypothetical protein BAJALOKI1v1_190001 [Promethearchaeota archaeon]|nr:MAG: hypothetical protein BAJALOKI1v1_190001 [Candidatus Lokiarchaeota archaeon]
MPLYGMDLNKPPLLSNLVPMSLPSYLEATRARKAEIFKKKSIL